MKYKCLVLDHDDTVVDSTRGIHYPCFVEYLKLTRPRIADKYSVDDYFRKNFDPGIVELLFECGLDKEELKIEEAFWRDYVKGHIPKAYGGIAEIIARFRENGGIIAVDSHSYKCYIERDFRENNLPAPDIIFGWDIPEEERKPSPATIFKIMEKFGLEKSDIIVVDDLKPGYDMARSAGVDFAAAGWAYDVPEIEKFMRDNCDYYLKSVEELSRLLFN